MSPCLALSWPKSKIWGFQGLGKGMGCLSTRFLCLRIGNIIYFWLYKMHIIFFNRKFWTKQLLYISVPRNCIPFDWFWQELIPPVALCAVFIRAQPTQGPVKTKPQNIYLSKKCRSRYLNTHTPVTGLLFSMEVLMRLGEVISIEYHWSIGKPPETCYLSLIH